MTLKRPLTLSALIASLLLAAPAAATDSGGVAVETYGEAGGGILAPAPTPSAPAPPAAPVPPAARAAQDEETPTTPEGEEQPEGEENGQQPPTEENGGADDEAPTGGGGGTGGETSGGFLPQTGLELAALGAIGLGLLLAGGALWPTRAWPPPRDRLSRSAPRR